MASIRNSSLAADALGLPEEDRAQLAVLLFESLEAGAANLWPDDVVAELRRRSEDLKSGRVRALTSEDVFGQSL